MSKARIERKGDVADYDIETDSFFTYTRELKYKSCIDIDGIVLDIAEDNSIMGIEILDFSNRFGISRYDAQHYKSLAAEITITAQAIVVEITLSVLKRNAELSRITEASAINSMNLPVGSESLAVTA